MVTAKLTAPPSLMVKVYVPRLCCTVSWRTR